MYDNFTQDSIKTIMRAQEEAYRLGLDYVGTEHILLGLLSTGAGPKVLGDGIACKVLRQLGLELNETRMEIDRATEHGSSMVRFDIPLTEKAKEALAHARNVSKQLGNDTIDTGHILLGLLSVKEGLHITVLQHFQVDLNAAKDIALELSKKWASQAQQ